MSPAAMYLCADNRGQEVFFRGAVLDYELGWLHWLTALEVRQRLGETILQFVEALDGAIVCGRGGDSGMATRYIGRDDQPNLLAHMVEGEHFIEEE